MKDLQSVLSEIIPCDRNRPYIFISYSSLDRELVWRDVLEFQRRGYNVWLDEKNLDKTQSSWKEDAIDAIEDSDCRLVVFYVSANSLCSDACYRELSKTVEQTTCALHNGPLKFIAVDVEPIGDIMQFKDKVYRQITERLDLPKKTRQGQMLALDGFVRDFFNSNNEKVRIHPQNEANRKIDYYDDITASFPLGTKIHEVTEEESPETYESDEEWDDVPTFTEEELRAQGWTDEDFLYLSEADDEDEEVDFEDEEAPDDQTIQVAIEYALSQGSLSEEEYETETLSEAQTAPEDLVEMQYVRGKSYFSRHSYETAVEWFTKAAEQGHAAAQNYLGFCYDEGRGVPRNYDKAVEWYTKAAEQGDADAQCNLGICYDEGRGVPRNYDKAVEWYTKAAEEGAANAQYSLGSCYYEGRGVPPNYETAVEWYKKAAEQGYAVAQCNLGVCYYEGTGVPRNYEKALEWFTKAAEQGDAGAEFSMGVCYYEGRGVFRDYRRAAEWFTKAAEHGDKEAARVLKKMKKRGYIPK